MLRHFAKDSHGFSQFDCKIISQIYTRTDFWWYWKLRHIRTCFFYYLHICTSWVCTSTEFNSPPNKVTSCRKRLVFVIFCRFCHLQSQQVQIRLCVISLITFVSKGYKPYAECVWHAILNRNHHVVYWEFWFCKWYLTFCSMWTWPLSPSSKHFCIKHFNIAHNNNNNKQLE